MLPENSLIYTHRHFSFGYNGDRIVQVNMTASDPQRIEEDKCIPLLPVTFRPIIFSYSASWTPSSIPFNQRFRRYFEYNDYEAHIHWFSMFNSFMMVVFLAGLVALIMMRTLRLDYIRYSRGMAEIGGTDGGDDSGWKRVHADVFRSCPHYAFYCILMVGIGARR